jgi:hypothetical protein
MRRLRYELCGGVESGGPRNDQRARLVTQSIAELLFLGCLALISVPVHAGLYHTRDSGSCQECHKPEATRQGPALKAALITAAPNQNSFPPMDVNQTCLDCHSGRGGPGDGPSVVSGTPVTFIRQAGFLNGPNGLGYTGHTLGSTQQAPGGTWRPGPQGLVCSDCHDPHGNSGQFRNLVLRPGTATEDRQITFVLSPANMSQRDVWIQAGLDGTGKYDSRNIRFNQPRPGRSAYGEWCQGCHTAFHGSAGSANMGGGANPWKRHPSADARIGAGPRQHSSLSRYASLANRVPTMSTSGKWPSSDNTVSCMSCHKAHGNGNPFGLLFMAGRGQLTEGGDSVGKSQIDLCHQCHTQGLS